MGRYCKGTGKYQLLNKLVDCDQCHGHEVVDLVAGPDGRVPRFADEVFDCDEKECPVPTLDPPLATIQQVAENATTVRVPGAGCLYGTLYPV